MNILNKIKNALFEEEEEEEQEIAKKIDVEKTVVEEPEIKIRHYDEPVEETTHVEKERITPVIFDVDDFVEEEPVSYKPEYQEYKKPIQKEQKIIYGGYVKEDHLTDKTKFKPSPIISPVYGILEQTGEMPVHKINEGSSLEGLFTEEKRKPVVVEEKKPLDFDKVREKAYGITKEEEPKEDKNLLYEMESVDEKPGIEKISIGDAEEYFEDLGLEYDVDYKDLAKEKMTRTKKNQELTEVVDEEIKEDKKIEEEMFKKQEDFIPNEEEVEEKNLYDLIDLMYDSKN